jgi:hypothetical protein
MRSGNELAGLALIQADAVNRRLSSDAFHDKWSSVLNAPSELGAGSGVSVPVIATISLCVREGTAEAVGALRRNRVHPYATILARSR